jgi:hypothetical protein
MPEYEQIKSIKRTEPRIKDIQTLINALLGVVNLEYEGEKVKVNGFSLRNLDDWTNNKHNTIDELLNNLARKCDSDCEFCYHKGNPLDFALGKKEEFVSELEMDTRVHFFDKENDKMLFEANYEVKELLYDPKTLKYLKQLRSKTNELYTINTNGLGLDEYTITKLAELKPLAVVFSVNSINQEKRDLIMKNSKKIDIYQVLTLLSSYKLTFVPSVAMWPTMSFDEIEHLIQVCDQFSPYFIRLIMPGYTDHFPKKPEGDFQGHFEQCLDMIYNLRSKIDTPLVIYPEAYVSHTYQLHNKPYLIGTVKGSPVYKSGLKANDVITKINGMKIDTRAEATAVLFLINELKSSLNIEYIRDGGVHLATVDTEAWDYPYDPAADFAPLGAMLSGSLRKSYVKEIQSLIESSKAKHILVMTSKLMINQVLDIFEQASCPLMTDEREIKLCIPENKYLGGNIIIGDMLATSDFILEIEKQKKLDKRVDLVLLPSSIFYGSKGWNRDLSGIYYKEIERVTGIKTCLIDCSSFLF